MKPFSISIFPSKNERRLSDRELDMAGDIVAKIPITIGEDNLIKLLDAICKDGCVFCPATFKEGIKSKKTFEQTQLFVLSFDNEKKGENKSLTFDTIQRRAEKYELPILYAYDAFSPCRHYLHTTTQRFVVVFLCEAPIDDLREAEVMQKALMTIFPEADDDCRVCKIHMGGNKILYLNEEVTKGKNEIPTLSIEWTLMKMCLYLKKRYGHTNYKRKIIEFSKQTGVSLNKKKLPDGIWTEIDPVDRSKNVSLGSTRDTFFDKKLTYTSIIENSKNVKELSSNRYIIKFDQEDSCRDNHEKNTIDNHNTNEVQCNSDMNTDKKKTEDSNINQNIESRSSTINNSSRSYYRSKDLDLHLRPNCVLYQHFLSDNYKLSHNQLLGLFSNIVQIETGTKKFKSTLKEKGYYHQEDDYEQWDYYSYYMKGSSPKPCEEFCPYHDTCSHGRTILATIKPRYHQIERIENNEDRFVSLDEAYEDFCNKFSEALSSDENIWHIIRSQTALGKTQAILSILQKCSKKILIAVPTNSLKREECSRAEEAGITIPVSPSLHEIEDDLSIKVVEHIEECYATGKSPMRYINKVIEKNKEKCVKKLKKYKVEHGIFLSSPSAITTHRKLTNMKLNQYDVIIIDEDIILSTVIPNRECVEISDLKELSRKLHSKDPLRSKIKKILRRAKKEEFFTAETVGYDESYLEIKLPINIPALCKAQHFCSCNLLEGENSQNKDSIIFVNPIEFQEGKKYIMLSATANQEICEYFFGAGNVRFYDCKEAALKGSLNQYGDKSMSRQYISDHSGVIDKIKKWSGYKHTITFKKFNEYCTDDMHFGNCAGSDVLKGKNIDVIGTPHQPEWIYKLFAFSMGYDPDDTLQPNRIVTYNGFRFRFTTYEDEVLRNIQFYMIESELEQAVGRARLLRCDCTVNLFSNFPLRQAELMESEYDE